jgi:hypothetical protein
MERDRRAERRVELSRRATLSDGVNAYRCLLQDFSSKGFFFITNQRFLVGQVLEFKCELYPEKPLQCRVEVKHINETCIGTKIVEISPEGQALLEGFLQEYYSLKLNQST